MTTRDAGLVGLGIVAGAALVGAGILLWNLSKGPGDEGGIRVKNGGSVHVETFSSFGFDFNMNATEFRSRRDTNGCYDLTVVAGSDACADATLRQVHTVMFYTSDRVTHGIGLNGKKVSMKRGKGWKPKPGNLDLTYGRAGDQLVRLVAAGEDDAGNSHELDCTFAGSSRQFDLISVACK